MLMRAAADAQIALRVDSRVGPVARADHHRTVLQMQCAAVRAGVDLHAAVLRTAAGAERNGHRGQHRSPEYMEQAHGTILES